MSAPDPVPSASAPLPVGYRLGEYAIAAVLGHGGFGITYRARDTKLGLDVAVKEYFPAIYATRASGHTIRPRPGPDVENYRWGLAEFLKEAQALAKFKHPHIVRVLRFMEANGTAYTIMEYEEGETLSAYLRRHGGVLLEARLLQIFLPILNGLQAVHDAGLLHLDIKPDNIYLRTNEQPMLIDFGSARQMRGDPSAKVTLTPGYCALEQYPGLGDVGPTADVYGMGATLYRCITGKSPVDALERYRTFQRTRIDPLAPAASFERPTYAAHIRACIDLALRLEAAERPASAHALQQGLMGKDVTRVAARAPASPYRPGTGYIGVVPAPAPTPKPARRHYTAFEKTVAALVFFATFAIVTPKLLVDTGKLSAGELYQYIDTARLAAAAQAQAAGDWINEHVFREPPRPKVAAPPVRRRPPAPPPPETAAAEPAGPPFATELAPPAALRIPEKAAALGFLQHGAVLAVATQEGRVQLWDTRALEARATLPIVLTQPTAFAVFPNTQWLAAADADGAIVTYDPLGNPDLTLVDEPARAARVLAVSANGLLLAETAGDGAVYLWELAQRRKRHRLAASAAVYALAFGANEDVVAAGDARGEIALWRTDSGERLAVWRAHAAPVVALALSPDARRLASIGRRGDLRLWSAGATPGTWDAGAALENVPARANAVVFAPDGRWLLATGTTGGVHIWDADTGRLARRLDTDARRLRALVLARDGRYLAAIGDDEVVRLWK